MKRPKVYIAARLSARTRLLKVRKEITDMYEVTSSWLDKPGDPDAAARDLRDIRRADFVIVDTLEGLGKNGGFQFECGYAYAKNKPIVIIGPKLGVFHEHASSKHYKSWQEFNK
jgi:hypothetical protein